MAKRFRRTNNNVPKVVISKDQPVPQKKPDPEALYCIEENVTTGWEILETNLTRTNCEQKYNHYANNIGLNPHSIRIRRIQ